LGYHWSSGLYETPEEHLTLVLEYRISDIVVPHKWRIAFVMVLLQEKQPHKLS
jgi:hypothetical protein